MSTEVVRKRETRCLDLLDTREVEAYERAFYRGFAAATHNRLVRWLWEWDDAAQRLRCRVPYAEQRIWTLTSATGEIEAAIAANMQLRTLQAAAYGFAVPENLRGAAATGRVCEFLTLFIVGDRSLVKKHALWAELFEDLRAEGYVAALATTAPRVLPLYRWAGVEVIGEATIEGEVRYFLRFDLTCTPGSGMVNRRGG